MDRRAIRRIIPLTLLAAACGIADCHPGRGDTSCAAGPALSREARAILRAERSIGVRATWILRMKDCLTCLTPLAELRRMTRGVSESVSVGVVVVGDGTNEVRTLMRRYRVEAEVISITSGSYRRAFGRRPLPGVYVMLGDSLIAAWLGEDAARAEIRTVALNALGGVPARGLRLAGREPDDAPLTRGDRR